MQFKHPEILYALFLLLIPIIIHLFQLRRFQKIDFTNVAFLKKATLQTRKSSRIKKWLTLLTRLLALAAIIMAFAQPFIASKTALNTEKETVIYIDNSFSMEAKGPNGPMLKSITKELFENLQGDDKISWFSNAETQRNVSQSDFKNEVLQIDYSAKSLSMEEVLLKALPLFSKSEAADKRLIILSDFQQQNTLPTIPENITVDIVKFKAVSPANISLDTVYISSNTVENMQLEVKVSGMGELPETTAISLINNDKLIAKTAVSLDTKTTQTLQFDIENPIDFNGVISIEDPLLSFDNTLFLSVNKKEPIKILVVNEGNTDFTRKLFNNEQYAYDEQELNQLNYSLIPNQNFIILNELKNIPPSLITALTNYHGNGGSIAVIPSVESDIDSYNTLLQGLQIGTFTSGYISAEKKITKINFSHPLYKNVFEKQVTNFQYPSVKGFFNIQHRVSTPLSMEDGKPFLLKGQNTYVFTAPLDRELANFKSSPLIVPTLINMAQQSLPLPNLYNEVGYVNRFAVPISMTQDEILTIKDSTTSFIPLQQSKANLVEITTDEEPSKSGTYWVSRQDIPIQWISYNYPREENRLIYHSLEDWEGANSFQNIDEVFENMAQLNNINELWKWFVIFAIVFLLFEMLILKNFK